MGLILPKEFVDSKGLTPDDPVRVEVERAARLEEVFGSLRKYRRSVREWNDVTNGEVKT